VLRGCKAPAAQASPDGALCSKPKCIHFCWRVSFLAAALSVGRLQGRGYHEQAVRPARLRQRTALPVMKRRCGGRARR
jgi:hypothetical protein